jgi:formamidopyrimidine-DNA glycosylase
MPELPDLEVFGKNLNKQFAGKTLKRIQIKVEKKLNAPAKDFQKHLENQTLNKIHREGKGIIFRIWQSEHISLAPYVEGAIVCI